MVKLLLIQKKIYCLSVLCEPIHQNCYWIISQVCQPMAASTQHTSSQLQIIILGRAYSKLDDLNVMSGVHGM